MITITSCASSTANLCTDATLDCIVNFSSRGTNVVHEIASFCDLEASTKIKLNAASSPSPKKYFFSRRVVLCSPFFFFQSALNLQAVYLPWPQCFQPFSSQKERPSKHSRKDDKRWSKANSFAKAHSWHFKSQIGHSVCWPRNREEGCSVGRGRDERGDEAFSEGYEIPE
jgi:hypothetical protein